MPAPVLVICDQSDIRDGCLSALRRAGHEVLGFDNATTALDAIEAGSKARVAVTRIDFGDGKLNGVAFARMLRLKRPNVRVVFLGQPEKQVYTDGLGDFLPKPLDPQALVDAVGHALG
jgi:DNA-binding NtrC family response regulator